MITVFAKVVSLHMSRANLHLIFLLSEQKILLSILLEWKTKGICDGENLWYIEHIVCAAVSSSMLLLGFSVVVTTTTMTTMISNGAPAGPDTRLDGYPNRPTR